MNSAGLDVDRLQRRKAGRRRHEFTWRKCASFGDNRGRTHGFRNRIDSAQPAAGGTCDMPTAFTQPGGFLIRQPHPQLDAVVEIDDLEGGDFFRRLYDAFAEAESDRKILE